jgi:hypothetical protein
MDFPLAQQEITTIPLEQRPAQDSEQLLVDHRVAFAKPIPMVIDIIVV